jgi:hypothetical protein
MVQRLKTVTQRLKQLTASTTLLLGIVSAGGAIGMVALRLAGGSIVSEARAADLAKAEATKVWQACDASDQVLKTADQAHYEALLRELQAMHADLRAHMNSKRRITDE